MERRQVWRRGDLELPSLAFQSQSLLSPNSRSPLSAGANEEEVLSPGPNWQLQQLREEEDPLLLNSPVLNWRFTLLEVVAETVRLTRARKTYFLVLLPTFILGILLLQGFMHFLTYETQVNKLVQSEEEREHCKQNIITPWREAAMANNLSASQQEEFYKLFKKNCTMFTDPARESGIFQFENGTFRMISTGYGPQNGSRGTGLGAFALLAWVWETWAQVAIAWGLYLATTATMGYSRPSHRDFVQMPSQKVTEALQEQFSYKVFVGVLRDLMTSGMVVIILSFSGFFITTVRVLAQNKSLSLVKIMALQEEEVPAWVLLDPFGYLLMLSGVAAALEPGMWGFKAMWRGIQVARGNMWKGCLICVLLVLWDWVCTALNRATALKPDQFYGSLWGAMLRSQVAGSLGVARALPGSFLVPTFYFLCKSWREKAAAMA